MFPIPKVEISGETARPVVDALIDVFSPVTEPMGWLGDAIRVHRARTVLKCFARTKQIAAEAGLKLKAPPIKFLTQYVENSSLEEEEDYNLIEWWSRLLVEAGSNYNTKHIFYTNVLKQLSSVELEIMEALVRNGWGQYRLDNATEAEFVHDFQVLGENIVLSDKFHKKKIIKSIDTIREEFEIPGALVLEIFVDDENSRQLQGCHPDYDEEELPSWQILQSLQLIRINYRRFVSGQVEYRVRLALITELGSRFYFSCHDKDFPDKLSHEVRFKREHKKTRERDRYEFSNTIAKKKNNLSWRKHIIDDDGRPRKQAPSDAGR